MKIYTRMGDDGTTGLIGGARVPKHDPRVIAYGATDELNAAIGVALTHPCEADVNSGCGRCQGELFTVGALLAAQDEAAAAGLPRLSDEAVSRLEREIDKWETELSPLRNFVLPGGSPVASVLHLARTVCRRAECAVSSLRAGQPQARYEICVRYLNRLSDWLFVAARVCNKRAGVSEVLWLPKK